MTVKTSKVQAWFWTLSVFVSVGLPANRNCQVLEEARQKGVVDKLILFDQSPLTLEQLRRLAAAECPKDKESLCFLNVQTTRESAAEQSSPTDQSCRRTLQRLLEDNGRNRIHYPVEGQVYLKPDEGSVYKLCTSADQIQTSVTGRNWTDLKTSAGSCELRFAHLTRWDALTLYIVCPQTDDATTQSLVGQIQAWRKEKGGKILVRTIPIFNEDSGFPWIPPLLTRQEMSHLTRNTDACRAVFCELEPKTKCDRLP